MPAFDAGRRAGLGLEVTEENQLANRPYRGSHRAGSLHHAEDHTAAQQRSSRVGRHYGDAAGW